jgi:hypothetical protein
MEIRETIDNPSTTSTECPPEDVIVLVDSARSLSECSTRSARKREPDCEANLAWLVIEASAVAGSQRANSRSCLSLRIIVRPLLDARAQPALN